MALKAAAAQNKSEPGKSWESSTSSSLSGCGSSGVERMSTSCCRLVRRLSGSLAFESCVDDVGENGSAYGAASSDDERSNGSGVSARGSGGG